MEPSASRVDQANCVGKFPRGSTFAWILALPASGIKSPCTISTRSWSDQVFVLYYIHSLFTDRHPISQLDKSQLCGEKLKFFSSPSKVSRVESEKHVLFTTRPSYYCWVCPTESLKGSFMHAIHIHTVLQTLWCIPRSIGQGRASAALVSKILRLLSSHSSRGLIMRVDHSMRMPAVRTRSRPRIMDYVGHYQPDE